MNIYPLKRRSTLGRWLQIPRLYRLHRQHGIPRATALRLTCLVLRRVKRGNS